MRGPLESRLLVAVGLVAAGICAACAEEAGTRGVYIIEAPQSPADSTQASPARPQPMPQMAAPESRPPILPPTAAAPPLDTEVPTALAPPRPALTPTATASAPLLQPTPPLAVSGSQPPILPSTAAAPPLDTEVPTALAPARPAATAAAPLPQPGFELSGHTVELGAPGARPDAALATPSPLKLDVENSAELSLELVPGTEVTVGTKISFRVRAKKSGYLVLVDIDPTGKLTQIYPNPQSLAGPSGRTKPNNFIKAGRTAVIPDLMSGTEYVATAPVGLATIVAVLSDRPVQVLDLADIPSFIADKAAEVAYLSRMTSELRILSDGAPQQARWSFDAKAYAIRELP